MTGTLEELADSRPWLIEQLKARATIHRGSRNISYNDEDAAIDELAVEALGGPATWRCAALTQPNGPGDPPECDWPTCGCDPAANKVIEALEEAGIPIHVNERLCQGCGRALFIQHYCGKCTRDLER